MFANILVGVILLALSAGRRNCAVYFCTAIPQVEIFHSHFYRVNAAHTRLAGSRRKRQPRRERRFRLWRSLRYLFSGAIKPAVSPGHSNHTVISFATHAGLLSSFPVVFITLPEGHYHSTTFKESGGNSTSRWDNL